MFTARVAELVDAPDSKSGASDGVRVQVPPLAPIKDSYWNE